MIFENFWTFNVSRLRPIEVLDILSFTFWIFVILAKFSRLQIWSIFENRNSIGFPYRRFFLSLRNLSQFAPIAVQAKIELFRIDFKPAISGIPNGPPALQPLQGQLRKLADDDLELLLAAGIFIIDAKVRPWELTALKHDLQAFILGSDDFPSRFDFLIRWNQKLASPLAGWRL